MNKGMGAQFQYSISPVVKWLLIINVSIWFIGQVFLQNYMGVPLTKYLSLVPSEIFYQFKIWQPFTYMFLHTLSVTHILFNMLMLWFIGTELENRWGRNLFIFFYIFSGVGAGLIYTLGMVLWTIAFPNSTSMLVPVVGASGAIYGLLLAYGILFGERIIHVMMIFPMKAKYFVILLGAIEFVSMVTSNVTGGGDIAYLAHLGGIAAGYVALLIMTRWQKRQFSSKAKRRSSNLKLVVDNEKPNKGQAPKYWN